MPAPAQLLLLALLAGPAEAMPPRLAMALQAEEAAPLEELPPLEEEGEEEEPEQRSDFPRLAAVQLGAHFTAHRIAYSEPGVEGLLDYRSSMVLAPALHVEFYPLSLLEAGPASELGLQVAYALSVGSKVRAGAEGALHSTRVSRWEVGVKYRQVMDPGVAVSLEPSLGLRSTRFSVSPATDGTALEGLPGLRYSALRAGLGVEVPRAAGLAFFMSASYLHALPGARLGAARSLSVDSDWGLEVVGGVGLWLGPETQLRLSGHYARTVFAFDPEAGQVLMAGGASDKRSGVVTALRWSY